MQDYLVKFVTDEGFDVFRLFDEDFLRAFKMCWSDRRYASAVKLLVSFIDTLAFLEYGDQQRNFQLWLDNFADMARVGVTADELWEFRNSLLHMTNSQSRKVKDQKVLPLTIYVGPIHPSKLPPVPDHKPLGVWQLYQELEEALCRWVTSMNRTPSKWQSFIERYDLIISDARYLEFSVPSETVETEIDPVLYPHL